jgi:serpin B
MKTKIFFTIIVSILLFSNCSKSDNEDSKKTNKDLVAVKSAIVDANNSFALNIFKSVCANDSQPTNVFISPMSIYYALSLTGMGARSETFNAFQTTLGQEGFDRQTMLDAIAGLYNDIIPTDNKVTVEIANSVWPKEGFPINQGYIDTARLYFKADVQNLDYSSPEAVNILNTWIEEKTNGKIQKMLSVLPSDIVLALVNAIYFKGDWKYQFDDTSNYSGSFLKEDGSQEEVTFMKQRADFNFTENSIFSSIQMPYIDSNYYMVVLLPNAGSNTDDIISQLDDENWANWMNSFSYQKVNVVFPKFKYSYGTRELNQELKDLGLSVAFSDMADFSGITERSVKIDQVLHKAFIEVNEKGSEAAAATVVTIIETSVNPNDNPEKYFNADHPFVFAICEKKSNSILFMGKLAYPAQE